MNEEQKDPTPYWWKLEKKALISQFRLWLISSVALNQFLQQVDVPKAVSVPAIAAAILAPAAKGALAFFSRQ